MRRWLLWFWMLSKRLYKRASFVAILALIPIAVLALKVAAQADSGFLHVVLAQTDSNDPISTALVEKFMKEESLIRFSYAEDPRVATDMVINGEADAAWIFPDDMQKEVDTFATSHYRRGDVVTVVEREQTVFSRISHEKLAFSLQQYTSRACYLNYARDYVPALDTLSDEELLAYFNEAEFNDELFLYRTPDGSTSMQPASDYLIAPVRGLLGVLVVLCGLAAALFYCQDKARGTFALVPEGRQSAVAFACLFIAVLHIGVVVLVALFASGLATFLLKDLLVVLLYGLCCASFCLLVLQMCGSLRRLAAVVPLLVVAMIALCPVFYDNRNLMVVQMLFPPTYFVNAAYDRNWLVYMLLYMAVCGLIALGVEWFVARWRMWTKK